LKIGKTQIFPAAIRYQNELAHTCTNLKIVGYTFDTDTLDRMTALVKELQDTLAALEKIVAGNCHDKEAEAENACHKVLPAMAAVRKAADALEAMVADDLWPLPTYQEMLFIK